MHRNNKDTKSNGNSRSICWHMFAHVRNALIYDYHRSSICEKICLNISPVLSFCPYAPCRHPGVLRADAAGRHEDDSTENRRDAANCQQVGAREFDEDSGREYMPIDWDVVAYL